MSTFHIIEDVQEQTNSCSSSTLNNNSSVVKHQIEKKRIRTIGNFNSNGTPFTTTATASSAKFSVTSTSEGKAVVSSLSMSLERKDSIQYMPKKIAPCIIPAGQSTVIHLDNYTHFMAQRVTTTKTAIKRSEIITEGQSHLIIPSSSGSTISESYSSNSVGGVGVGIVDVDFKVLLGGVSSSYRCNNKTFNMNKQKMLDSKATSTKIRGRKNSLALEHKQQKEINNMTVEKADKSDSPTALKSILKKPKTTNRRRKVIKPRKPRTTKVKGKNNAEETNISEETTCADEVADKTSLPHITQTDNDSKILQPCIYTLQSKKCLSEMTCKFLHSDFPCKYYYLNLQCPKDFKCQFMHNGPLEPKLMEALRSHILDLLTTKPSAVETHFIEQLHSIEDLTQRLLAFEKNHEQQTCEIIEVMDDNDEEQVLVIDESSDEVQTNNFTAPPATSLRLHSSEANTTIAITTDKYDTMYQNFKETNTIIDEIDLKLQNLKTTSNMTPNEKIHELQNIYELLKEQEKRLPIYENLNTSATSAQISTMYNQITNNSIEMSSLQSNPPNEQQHIVLVNPEIVNEIQISEVQENSEFVNGIRSSGESQENHEFNNEDVQDNVITITDDNESLTAATLNVPQESGMEFLNNDKLPQQENDTNGNNDMINIPQEQEVNDNNMSANLQNEDLSINTETVLNNTDIIDKDNFEKPTEEEVYNDKKVLNETTNSISNTEMNDNSNKEEVPFESEQFQVAHQPSIENLDTNKSLDLNDNEQLEQNIGLNNAFKQNNEILELAITMDEKEVIESQIEVQRKNEDETEEESPPYEHISIAKPTKERRLRSHTQQDNGETSTNSNNEKSSKTSLEVTKPIKTRRLRLPKPSIKTSEKSNSEDYQINADIINKLINAPENSETYENADKTKTFLEDAEIPLTQNVILTKRFMKKAKAKLEQQSLLNETIATTSRLHNTDNDVELKMFALHKGDNQNLSSIENIDVTLLTQTSEESYTLNPSQDPLITDDVCDNATKLNNEIPTSSDCCYDHIITPIRNKKKAKSSANLETPENSTNTHTKRRISFENPSSSLAASPSTYKEQFNLADDNRQTTQKRRSFTPEYDLDSSLKDNKCLKIDVVKSRRKVNFDTRQRTYSEQSNTSKEERDFDTDSSDEKLTIVDTLQTSTPTGNERKQAIEPATTTHTVVVTHHSHHQHVHKEQEQQQQENESDLRQQIENVSNKSDLQLQIQQQQEKQQKEVEKITTATTSFISENSNNLPHKQYQQGNVPVLVEKEEQLLQQKQSENKLKEEAQIAMARNPYGNNESDGQTQHSSPFKPIDEPEKPTSNASDKYSKENFSVEMKENVEYSTYSSLYNKLSAHSTKCQINFENSSVNITPISSPTYGDDTIASPSPVRRSFEFRLGGEIDGRLTYPPIPYILHEIDLGRVDINKPICIDKLKKTLQLDPRIFRTHVKKQLMTLCKPTGKTSNALVSLTTSNTSNLSHGGGASVNFAQPTNTTMVSPYDPRNRTPALMTDIATPIMTPQTALTPYNNMNVVAATSPSASLTSSPYMNTDIPNAVPLALQYHSTAQPILQPQQQQTPNMFLYGCLQRSPWYQSLMSTMKIQINQSISQLVRALNNFHRERLLNPEMVFDVFKIDCAGELLEIMRNLGIFVDANGIINEQRHVPSFGGRSCCNTMPVNATYSFIQQVLTPNTHCTSMTTASSTYNAAGGAAAVGSLNVNEPFVSCYIKAPEPPIQKHSDECGVTSQHGHHDDHNNNNNTNSSVSSNCNRCCNNTNSCCDNGSGGNNNQNSHYNQNNNNNNRRFGNQFKKPYDNNYNNNNGSNSYQPRSNQRSSYSNNPRFNKPGLSSPSKSNSSPPNSPRGRGGGGFDSGSSYGGGGRGGRGGFNNNRRFNNFKNKDNNYDNNASSSWSSSSAADNNENRFNKFQNNNSPPRSSSPISSFQSGSPRPATAATKSSPPPVAKKSSTDEECWDSDN
ncbi:inner centromere protein A-like isoform X2 [Lucilia sericata]|uniref:inner centromere protein A-like isoform X2 n=1 Tax=Lucilia sericata TaxID=13632 RepID=UPI0018A84CD8|nr:inner centromere protein A-like isoform X2 [Lucilia sericata]